MSDRPAHLPGVGAENPPSQESARDPADRLESWKETAAYLRRSLRTVQRWETQEGLPVHRHQHDERSSVFAYKSELDVWLRSAQPRLESEGVAGGEQETAFAVSERGNGQASVLASGEPKPEGRLRVSRRRWYLWLSGATVAVVTFAAAGVYFLRPRPASVLHFHPRDKVLIASFDNHTGEPLFDGTLEAALARELTNSQFATVAPRVRINDTLALMRKPANTRVDAVIGRQICLRDGGIRALITGRIDKVGPTYYSGH